MERDSAEGKLDFLFAEANQRPLPDLFTSGRRPNEIRRDGTPITHPFAFAVCSGVVTQTRRYCTARVTVFDVAPPMETTNGVAAFAGKPLGI